jgi:hypothetical protein
MTQGGKMTAPGMAPAPRWCPTGLTRTQRRRVHKLRAKEIEEKRREDERDRWFNQERHVIPPGRLGRKKELRGRRGVMGPVMMKRILGR